MIELLNSFAENWMAYFGYAIMQNTLFLAVIFLVLYKLREKLAAIQYAVAALGLIKLLVPPFVPFTIRAAATAAPAIGAVEVGDIAVSSVEAVPAGPSLSLLSILFLVWAFTVILMLSSTLISTLKLKWHLRDSVFVTHTEIDGKAIDVYSSRNISVPMSIGLFPKRVYVPTLWSGLSDDLKRSLLRHEVAHIKRKDGLFGALQTLAQAVYFFHPLVWILTRQANELREMACDDMAVEDSEVTPLVYSRCLVHVAEHMLPSWSCSSASTLIKQKNKLYTRVNYQVKETNMKKLSKNRSRLIWTLLLVLVVPLSWYCKQPDATVGMKDGNTGKIYGKVTNTKTGEPIAGANIIVYDTPLGAATNKDGDYVIANVPAGRHSVKCMVIGYSNVIINDLIVSEDKSTLLNFDMELTALNYDKIVITNEKAKIVKSAKPAEPAKPAVNAKPASPAMTAPIDEFTEYDVPPKPVGGFSGMLSDLRYPEVARAAGVEGKVIVSIFINKNGKVTGHQIKEGFVPAEQTDKKYKNIPKETLEKAYLSCEDEAVKALSMSEWKPALFDNKPVGVWVTVPVKYDLKTTKATKQFIAYDTPPELINGAIAIQSNLVYPEEAKKAGEQGTVLVQIKIGEDGKPKETKILKSFGSKACDEAAQKAIMKTQWKPAQQRDENVSVWITLPVEFKLSEKK